MIGITNGEQEANEPTKDDEAIPIQSFALANHLF